MIRPTCVPRNERQLLREAALAYANTGWPVFPLRPGSKRPATPNHTAEDCNHTDTRCWAGHTGWEQRATTDSARIGRAWDSRPYGIGIACGPAGLLVVDLDVPKGDGVTGLEALRSLEREHGQQLPATFTVATPSGGHHLYFTTRQPLGNTASKIGPRIDTRGAGGYVVAPPTQLPNARYQVIDNRQAAELPDWFSQLLQTTKPPDRRARPRPPVAASCAGSTRVDRYITSAINGELNRIAAATEGQRNQTLFIASVAIGQMVGAHLLPAHQAEQILEDASCCHVAAGAYGTAQARKTIASGLRRGFVEPRILPESLLQGSRA